MFNFYRWYRGRGFLGISRVIIGDFRLGRTCLFVELYTGLDEVFFTLGGWKWKSVLLCRGLKKVDWNRLVALADEEVYKKKCWIRLNQSM